MVILSATSRSTIIIRDYFNSFKKKMVSFKNLENNKPNLYIQLKKKKKKKNLSFKLTLLVFLT